MRLTRKTTATVLGVTLSAVTFVGTGCVPANLTSGGPIETRRYDVSEFTAVQVNSNPMAPQVYERFAVDIVPSDTCSVTVTANDNLFRHIYVSCSGSTLRLQLRDAEVNFSPVTLEARVSMPQLLQVSATGAAEVAASGFTSAHDFKLDISGGARANLNLETGDFAATIKGGRASGNVRAADTHIEVFGIAGAGEMAGTAEFTGSARDLVLRGGVGAEAALQRFSVHNADVVLIDSGIRLSRAEVAVDGQLDVTLIGPTILWYSGNVTLGRTSAGRESTLRERP